MDNCTQNIAIGFLFIIIIYLVINQKNISKNQENFALSSDDLTLVRTEINRIYDMDVEAIRNLGAISKSLLTGTNTFTPSTSGTPGDLNIPADNTILQGGLSLLNTTWEATKMDTATSHIVSDTGNYKSLMILGNDSSGTRKVKLWDDVTVSNNLTMDGNVLTLASGAKITSPGRLHVSGEDNLYILNKTGVVIGKEWGGSGDLSVQGNQTNNGTLSVDNNTYLRGLSFQPSSWAEADGGVPTNGHIYNESIGLAIVGSIVNSGRRRVGLWDDVDIHGDLTIEANRTISSTGRINVTSSELVHIYSKNGLYVGKTNGGSGDITAEGNIIVNGNQNTSGTLTVGGSVTTPWVESTGGGHIASNLVVGGSVTTAWIHSNSGGHITGGLTVGGEINAGGSIISPYLKTTGGADIASNLVVGGSVTTAWLHSNGGGHITGGLSVGGAVNTSSSVTTPYLKTTGGADIASNLVVGGSVTTAYISSPTINALNARIDALNRKINVVVDTIYYRGCDLHCNNVKNIPI